MLLYQTRPSNSAHVLRDQLGVRRVRDELTPISRRRLARNRDGLILNWGNSQLPPWDVVGEKWINKPEAVAVAVSKFRSLAALAEHDIPAVEVTRDHAVVQGWHREGRASLLRRDGLSGGQGIIEGPLYDPNIRPDQFWSKVFPKTHEFRVHVVKDKAIDFVEKKARAGVEVDRLIRSYDNGWVFAHDNLSVTPEDKEELEDMAIEAVMALGLDFGAVDLLGILDKRTPRRLKKARVCEVNTAPGLENTKTIEAYVAAFREIVNG